MGVSVLFFFLLLQGCSSDDGTSGGSAFLSGTAASGAPIANATVTVKDATGAIRTTTTDANGKYKVDVSGTTPPFLLKVDRPGGGPLFSVGSAAGVVNIHAYTDLIIKTCYQVRGLTIADGFGNPAGNPPPDVVSIRVASGVVRGIVEKWMVDEKIDPETFDLITSPFDANRVGFDKVLDRTAIQSDGVTITDGTVTQTSALAFNVSDGSVTVRTTTAVGGVTSSSVASAILPNTPTKKAAFEGAQASLKKLAEIVNSKGSQLADSDLISLFASDYLDDGANRNFGAGESASDFRGIHLNSATVDGILSYDDKTKVVTVGGAFSVTEEGKTVRHGFNDDGHGLAFREQSDGAWLLYGNQRLGRVTARIRIENRMDPSCGNCPNPVKVLQLQEEGAAGAIIGVSVKDSLGSSFTLTRNPLLSKNTFKPTPTTSTTVDRERFDLCPPSCAGLSEFPSAGTAYTFNVTPSSGAPRDYIETVQGNTTETISITGGLAGHSLADAKLGQQLTVNWTLPKTFPIAEVNLRGFVVAGSNGCDIDGDTRLPPTATSGTITLPTTCGGGNVVSTGNSTGPVPASINVEVVGTNGETTTVWFPFR